MNEQNVQTGVWFIYDGECPVCKNAAQALRIKKELGPLHLLDARTEIQHLLIDKVNQERLNLDEGMVIYHQGQLFHGSTALEFMAIYGAPSGIFNRINRLLFRSPLLSKTLYPLMRAVRNFLLLIRHKPPIHNLINRKQPTFQSIFGADWDKLPPVMLKHYANRPFCNEVNTVQGTMAVQAAPILRLATPMLRLLGGIPAVNENNVPVTVRFESDSHSNAFHFRRTFHFPNQKPYVFHSKMIPQHEDKVVEQMKFGLGWRVAFEWRDNRVILAHNGYCLCIWRKFIPVPLNWLIGKVHAEEWALDDNSFEMFVEIRHFLFGKIYEYRGRFDVIGGDD